jgi:beta-lactamase class A
MHVRIVILALLLAVPARANFRELLDVPKDPSIETKLRHAAEAALEQFPNLKADDLALSVVDVTNPTLMARGDYHGDVPFYPASVIKLFFMADVYQTNRQWLGDVQRAIKEMIVVSDNDATAYLVDILANTSGGPELQGRALHRYIDQRRDINRRFERLGYKDNVSAMMKPWSFGPFGRDRQVLGPDRVNRNKLTANATSSLLLWIQRGRAVSPAASAAMGTFLHRPLAPQREEENQVKEFIGEVLPAGSKLWSKAGWTSEVRHDAAYIELPSGRKLVLVIFTRGQAGDLTLIPGIAKHVLKELE